jgi:hypothetical protein
MRLAIFLVLLLAGGGCTAPLALDHAIDQNDSQGAARLIARIRDAKDPLLQADEQGETPLHRAAFTGNAAIGRMLADKFGGVSALNGKGWTPLHTAADACNAEMTGVLLDHGAAIEARTADQWTALALACMAKPPEVAIRQPATVSLLLDRKADPNAAGPEGWMPMHCAALLAKPDVMNLLIAHGADLSSCADDGLRPLELAAAAGNTAVVETLLDRGVRPESLTFKYGPCAASFRATAIYLQKRGQFPEALRDFHAASELFDDAARDSRWDANWTGLKNAALGMAKLVMVPMSMALDAGTLQLPGTPHSLSGQLIGAGSGGPSTDQLVALGAEMSKSAKECGARADELRQAGVVELAMAFPRVRPIESAPRALAALESNNAWRIHFALDYLAAAPPAGSPLRDAIAEQLAVLVAKDDQFTARDALGALGLWATSRNSDELIRIIDSADTDPTRRAYALEALGSVGDLKYATKIAGFLETSGGAAAGLIHLGPAVESIVLPYLDDPKAFQGACNVLAEVGTMDNSWLKLESCAPDDFFDRVAKDRAIEKIKARDRQKAGEKPQ